RQRQHDPEHQPVKNRKQLAKDSGLRMDDDVVRGRRKKGKQVSAQQMMAPIKIETAYMTAETITVRDLTERIGKPAGEIIKKLMLLGIMATINQELDYDTASLVASEFGVTLEMKLDKTAEDALSAENVEDSDEQLQPRPPVVTIMGHVDHGKTSLLDYIRKTKVTAGEAGGITQHIGAYTAHVSGRQITFLDTPGHEAFTAMRARGTQATDIAILVVAADDGVMPQTIESIHHARAAKCPIIVAINKIDKPDADPDRVKQGLTQYELVPEEWGGDTIMVPVSAKTGEGVDDLLENVLLMADMLELRANPNRKARGVIIEAKLDHSRGAVATALVQNGTLHVGDMVVAGGAYGRVRAMVSSRGDKVKTALPSTPVELVGFGEVPEAGDEFIAVEDEKLARQVVEERAAKARASMVKNSSASTLEELFGKMAEGEVKDLNIIIKADVQGSVEAVKQSLEKLSNEKVHVKTIHSGVGGVTENDVMLAGIDHAIIIGFNVRPDAKARAAAERDGIDIRYYRIIYQAIEDVEKAMKGLLSPEFKENLLGHAQVRNVFRITGVGVIAGGYVTDGKIQRNAQVRLLRDNVVVFEGKLSSLQRFKDAVREVSEGYECGVGLENYSDIKEGDVIECFLMEQIEQ
ncbi:MAG: translation initiation factor IF-2, partial [Clostridia bacterium]|nr:translation initiation factor IF-2 [Clostridia bacterium]